LRKPGQLRVVHGPEAGLRQVGDRELRQVRIVERQDVALVDERLQERDLAEDFQEMKIGAREIVHPRRLAAETAAAHLDGGDRPARA
jgi:hypothetical protein